jgi:predicted transcriptional regulator
VNETSEGTSVAELMAEVSAYVSNNKVVPSDLAMRRGDDAGA